MTPYLAAAARFVTRTGRGGLQPGAHAVLLMQQFSVKYPTRPFMASKSAL
jgi:hypothetical protein